MFEGVNDATLIDFYNKKANPLIRKRIQTELNNRGHVIMQTSFRFVLARNFYEKGKPGLILR